MLSVSELCSSAFTHPLLPYAIIHFSNPNAQVLNVRNFPTSWHIFIYTVVVLHFSMVEAIMTMEQLHDLPLLWRLADFCKLDTLATHVRLWPQHDVRHPSIVIEERKLDLTSPVWPRYIAWLRARLHPGRYQVHIPVSLQQEVLSRISSRESVRHNTQSKAEPYLSQQLYNELIKRLTTLENLLSNKT